MDTSMGLNLKPLTLDDVSTYQSSEGKSRVMATVKGYMHIAILNGDSYRFYHSPHNSFPCPACFRISSETKACKNQKDMAVFTKEIRLRSMHGAQETPDRLQVHEVYEE